MIDFEKFFDSILEEEDGATKLSNYLDEIARSANKAIDKHSAQKKKEIAIESIAEVFERNFGDMKLFSTGDFQPKDAAEAVIETLLMMDKMASEGSLGLKEVLSEILK